MLQLETAGSTSVNLARSAVDRRFYVGVGLFMIVLSLVGFVPSMVEPSARAAPLPLTPIVAMHGGVSALWILLYVVQAWLAASHRIALHRILGFAGIALAAAIVVTGWLLMVEHAQRGFDLAGDTVPPDAQGYPRGHTPGFLFGPFIGFVHFAIAVSLAVVFRRRPDVHKRLMTLALLGGLGGSPLVHTLVQIYDQWPALRQFEAALFNVFSLLLLSIQPIYDRLTNGRIHPVSLWGGLALIAITFFIVIGPSERWNDFAKWAIS